MIKIVSLNIELDRHFDLVLPFLQKQEADVLLLQEVLEKDLEKISQFLKMQPVFTPLCKLAWEEFGGSTPALGIASFSQLKVMSTAISYYSGSREVLPVLPHGQAHKMSRAFIKTVVEKNGEQFCLVNTHFTWTPDGMPNARQRREFRRMLDLLLATPELILCGDFNASRGREIFDQIAKVYKDNIPQNITTTIDQNLHRRKNLQLVVDGLFTTKGYEVRDVEIVDGVSDHCAIVAHVTIKKSLNGGD